MPGAPPDDPRAAEVPASRLVGIVEIADLLGVQRTTVDLWRTRDRRGRTEVQPMPQPLITRSGKPLWDRDAVVAWAVTTGRLRQG